MTIELNAYEPHYNFLHGMGIDGSDLSAGLEIDQNVDLNALFKVIQSRLPVRLCYNTFERISDGIEFERKQTTKVFIHKLIFEREFNDRQVKVTVIAKRK